MNAPITKVTPGHVAELAASVQTLNRTVGIYSEEISRLNRRQQRTKFALTLTVLGLILDVALSGLLMYQHTVQTCFNARAQQLFNAEFQKVSGQITGELTQRNAVVQIIRGGDPRGGLAQFEHGTDQWITASRTYLSKISHIQGNC